MLPIPSFIEGFLVQKLITAIFLLGAAMGLGAPLYLGAIALWSVLSSTNVTDEVMKHNHILEFMVFAATALVIASAFMLLGYIIFCNYFKK